MTDLYLDPLTHDIVIDDGDLKLVSGDEEIKQRLKVTLLAQSGEWLFDTAFGVPYREEILVRNPDLGAIEARLRGIIASVEGVTAIRQLDLIYDRNARTLTVDGQVDTRNNPLSFSIPII